VERGTALKSRNLSHPVLGDRVLVLVTPEESSGELLRIEYLAQGVTPPPENHWHPEQEERVEVLTGTLRCRLGSEERLLRARDRVVFPAGVPHALWNDDPAGSRSIGEYRPALDTLAMFEFVFTATPEPITGGARPEGDEAIR